MSKYLVIVESPAKAKTISKFLGKNYQVQASMGHLIDLPKSQLGVDIEDNFKPKYITIRGKGDILKSLKKAGKKAEQIFLAGDPDREGEAICWHLAKALGVKEDEACRVEFNEITKDAVKKAFKQPRLIDNNRVDAQQARRVLDRVVGYKISPLLWQKVRKGLSAGRVQSVAVRIIVDREEEIEAFVPEEYWSLDALLSGEEKKKFIAKFHGQNKKKIVPSNQEEVEKITAELNKEKFIVEKVEKKERKRNPSAPFTTSSLQQEASKKLNFTAKKTMMLAQQLYEGITLDKKGPMGLITYIRTDAVRVSTEAISQAQALIKEKYGEDYLPDKPRVYSSKKGSQEAHEAIRPTLFEYPPENIDHKLSKDQSKLYRLIWERFLASQMSSAVLDTVRVDITVGSYLFRATGSRVKFPGFMVLDKSDSNDKEEYLPHIEEGQELKLHKLEPKQHFTQPPPRYNEAMLVKTLEEKGIGRPSTYAPIIETIQHRGYVKKDNKAFIPSDLGKIVVDILKDFFPTIMDIDFTAQMESKLDMVEEGESDWAKIIESFYGPFEESLKKAEEEMKEIEIEEEVTDELCPKCGENLVVKHGRFGKFLACPGFPDCRYTKPILKETGVKCPLCEDMVVERKSKKGRLFYGCQGYPECNFINWNKPIEEKCPECSSYMVEKVAKKSKSYLCSSEDCGYKKKVENEE